MLYKLLNELLKNRDIWTVGNNPYWTRQSGHLNSQDTVDQFQGACLSCTVVENTILSTHIRISSWEIVHGIVTHH